MDCKKVLIIDDDEAIRETIGVILEARGYVPILAADGREGLNKLKSETDRPNVILLDMMMPGTNGWEFLDEQRTNPDYASIPVIICTAYAESGKSVRPDAYLPKPVELKTLVSTIQAFCDQGSESHSRAQL